MSKNLKVYNLLLINVMSEYDPHEYDQFFSENQINNTILKSHIIVFCFRTLQ